MPAQNFDFVAPYTFIRRTDGKSYELGALLETAVNAGHILVVYSNAFATITPKIVTGQFHRIDVASLKRDLGIPPELRPYTVVLPTAIMGQRMGETMEHSLPHLHYIDENTISIGSNAHAERSYALETTADVYFCNDDTEWKKAFFQSLKEYSVRTYNPAIRSLFTAFDLLTSGLVSDQTKIEMRLSELNRSHPITGFNRLKKNLEKKIMKPFDALRHANASVGFAEIQEAYKAAFPILWWLETSGSGH